MTPVLCESFNNNNNNNVVGCGKMSEYAEYPEYHKQTMHHYTDHHHPDTIYPYSEVSNTDSFVQNQQQLKSVIEQKKSCSKAMFQVAGEAGDSGEGWSEGDEGSVDGLAREVYREGSVEGMAREVYTTAGYNTSPFTSANHPTYFDNSVPMYDGFQVRLDSPSSWLCSQISIWFLVF